MKRAIWITAAVLLLIVGIWVVVGRTGHDSDESGATNDIPKSTGSSAEVTDNGRNTGFDSAEDVSTEHPGEDKPDVFQTITDNGYSGTIEEWLASLVGENAGREERSAFSLAAEKGYRGSYEDWMQTLTGSVPDDQTKTAYQAACSDGRKLTLTAWLNSLVKDPESLGHSADHGTTEYERACQNGFQGTFIEWIVSLVGLN